MRTAAVATLTLLAALAVSGCLGHPGGSGQAGAAEEPSGNPLSGHDGQDVGPSAMEDVPAPPNDDPPGRADAPLEAVVVTDVGSHYATVTYRVGAEAAGLHQVGAVAAGTDRPWTWTEPVNESGHQEVRLEWLHANTTHQFTVRLEDGDGGLLAEVHGTFRTEPVPYAWADPEKAVVRPGAQLSGGNGSQSWGCTVGFILTDASNSTVYALTAGHCLRWAEEVVHDVNLRFVPPYWQPNWDLDDVLPWTPYNATYGGVVEYWEAWNQNDRPDEFDWGLVRIHPNLRARVSPSMVHWTGPTGVAAPGTVEAGADVCYFGQAGASPPPMRDRCGHFVAEDVTLTGPREGWYTMQAPVGWDGDSGSPVLDYRTGGALGIITHGAGSVFWGPTLDAILDRAALAGYDLRLATAPYDPPMSLPVGDGGLP